MPQPFRLSALAASIADAIEMNLGNEPVWVTAQITDVKRQHHLRRCYLKMIEKADGEIIADLRANFWTKAYGEIEEFERKTGQAFRDGLEVTAQVVVRFHARYGISLDVLKLEIEWTLGSLERERLETLERLVRENPATIKEEDGIYTTANNSLILPTVIRRIALITAPNSDGQRDFIRELDNNRYGYRFSVTEFLTTIQGDDAHLMIMERLKEIQRHPDRFDIVCIVRGGGSQTDFRPFDQYELAKAVSEFPIPVFTGIGHDRNTSITDLMARQEKTPTKVAAAIVDRNATFEQRMEELQNRFERAVNDLLQQAENDLDTLSRMLRTLDPANTLRRGFAIVEAGGKAITGIEGLQPGMRITTRLSNGTLDSTIDHINGPTA